MVFPTMERNATVFWMCHTAAFYQSKFGLDLPVDADTVMNYINPERTEYRKSSKGSTEQCAFSFASRGIKIVDKSTGESVARWRRGRHQPYRILREKEFQSSGSS